MISLRNSLAAGLVLGALLSAPAQAAPVQVQAGLGPAGLVDTVAMYHYRHHRMHRHHSTRHERMMRRRNVMRHGDPNARNPQQPGYKQQLGNTTGGPRY
ncbi:hypothetical protein [Methylobacterium persicinum]|uniref:Uncharacterized protein n=1 Tax=Methylobacterium persicinum TaxID=374426 RepID=A0ABU0HLK4_9HYPH|nr:hypothetical protein [Methylobacterium persicinum]GJE37135.1 hypothetical protein KHHGKMAE_1191 [Methylobacterium persicinum]